MKVLIIPAVLILLQVSNGQFDYGQVSTGRVPHHRVEYTTEKPSSESYGPSGSTEWSRYETSSHHHGHTDGDSSSSTDHHDEVSRTSDHHHQGSTEEPVSRTSDHQYEISTSPPTRGACEQLFVQNDNPLVKVGHPVRLECTCIHRHRYPYRIFQADDCPHFKGVYDVIHSLEYTLTQNSCRVTLTIPRMNQRVSSTISCVDLVSKKQIPTHLHPRLSEDGEPCDASSDCKDPLTCEQGKCFCPPEAPVSFAGKCYPMRKLLSSCTFSAQCKALDREAICTSPEKICMCGPGYEMDSDRKCVCEDCGFRYVYSFSRKYQTVFYVLVSISVVLIIIGLIRLCLVSRRSSARRPGVFIATRDEDCSPLASPEKPKIRF